MSNLISSKAPPTTSTPDNFEANCKQYERLFVTRSYPSDLCPSTTSFPHPSARLGLTSLSHAFTVACASTLKVISACNYTFMCRVFLKLMSIFILHFIFQEGEVVGFLLIILFSPLIPVPGSE